MDAYDPNNVFAKILRGELPCHRVYEDERTLAFLDIMPRADGHTLVIPKAPARNIFDIKAEDLAAVVTTARRLAPILRAVTGADGMTIQQFNESAGGQVVFHYHMHLIPRWNDQPMRPAMSYKAPSEQLAALAAVLKERICN